MNKNNKEVVNFSVDVVNAETLNPNISRYKCYICYPDEPANNYVFSKKVLEDMIPSIVGAGVYTYFSENLEKFGGHEDNLIYNGKQTERTGELKAIGFVDTATMPFWEKRKVNGKEREYLTSYVYLWSGSHPILKDLDKLKIFQSMEVETATDKINGMQVVKKAIMHRLVLIGDSPAFDGSTFIKFSKEKADENSLLLLKQEFNSVFSRKDIATIIKEKEKKRRSSNVALENTNFAAKEGDGNVNEKDKDLKDKENSEFTVSEEDRGTGDAIDIDKSKDSLSDTAWGDVDKTDLRNKVLKAKNYKTLVHSVYLRVGSDWENSPSSELGYPVMQIKGGKAVYNAGGLSSALGFARAHNHNDVVTKVLRIRKKMGMETEMAKYMKDEFVKMNKDGISFSSTSENGTLKFLDTKANVGYQLKEDKLLKFNYIAKMNNDEEDDEEDDEDEMDELECSLSDFVKYVSDKFAEIDRDKTNKDAEFGQKILDFQNREKELNDEKKDIEEKFAKVKEDLDKANMTISKYEEDKIVKDITSYISQEQFKSTFTETEKADFIKDCTKFTFEENKKTILAKFAEKVISGEQATGRANFTQMSILNPKTETDKKETKNDPYKLVSMDEK